MATRRRSARSNEPSGYYFTVGPGMDDDGWDCTVYMTDAAYFDTTGAQSDWHITTELSRGGMRMPPGLSEEAEGVFTYEGQPQAAIEDLTRRGFRTSDAFRRLVGESQVPQEARIAHVERQVGERQERERQDEEYQFPETFRGRGAGNILVPALTREVLARAPLAGLSLGDMAEMLNTYDARLNNEPPTVPTRRRTRTAGAREAAVPKKPPGKTIWERLDEDD